MKKSLALSKTNTTKGPDFASLIKTLRQGYTHPPEKGLYIVPTPIGNAEDITLRALKILDCVDLVACEDTRHTGRLLSRYGISTRRVAYHDHSRKKVREKLIQSLLSGASIALVSDSGTPLISDPGFKLVQDAIMENIPVFSLPGPSSPITALVLAGLPPDKFFFSGFLPNGGLARSRALESLSLLSITILLLESPHRIERTLSDLLSHLGDRPASVARELTKIHEEVIRGPLSELLASFQKLDRRLRGELIVAVGPPTKTQIHSNYIDDLTDSNALLLEALKKMSTKMAVHHVARATGLSRRLLYNQALEIKKTGK